MSTLIASDLDGTLLGGDGQVSPRTIRAVRGATGSGATFVAATGRSYASAVRLLEPVGAIEWAVCSNGALRYHIPTQAVASYRALPNDVALAMAGASHGIDDVRLSWETPEQRGWTRSFIELFPEYFQRVAPPAGLVVDEVPPLERSIKFLAAHPEMPTPDLHAALSSFFGDQATVAYSGAAFCEITAPGADKGAAMAELASDLGLDSSDSLAFGDQNNDVSLLQWAGTGVAMANANPELLVHADDRAPHHAEDGVAQYLEQRFGLQDP